MLGRVARRVSGLGVLLVVAAGVRAEELPIQRGVGQRMTSFSLPSTTGQTVSVDDYRMTRGRLMAGKFDNVKKAVVVAFLGIDCPVGNLYAPRLIELNQQYKGKGVAFLAIDSNAHDTVEQMAQYARENKFDFPFLKDLGNVVADENLVQRTCEVLVLNSFGQIVYRGAIDDQYGVGTRKDKPTQDYLRDALDATLARKPVKVAATAVVGCLLDRVEPKVKLAGSGARLVRDAPSLIVEAFKDQDEKAAAAVGKVTYAHDVAKIFQAKCQLCHRPGQVAPFSLLSYDDARRHSTMIEEVVEDRRMPPWHADPRFGHFRNDRSLTPQERAQLLAWIKQGAPLGDPQEVPPPKPFADGWLIGKPDVVFEIPEPYTVPAQGVVEYVDLEVPTHFQEDMWVQAAEARPGDRTVVHHIIVFIKGSDPAFLINDEIVQAGKRRALAQKATQALLQGIKGKEKEDGKAPARPRGLRSGETLGDGGMLCGFAPGDIPMVFPDGIAKKVPAGATLRFQIHYTPVGKVRTDRSKVGLIFAKAPVKYRARTVGIVQMKFEIPAGAANHPVASSFTLASDTRLFNFMPHMHLRGKSFEYKATYPDGRQEVLLSVPAFDFGWQSYYNLAEPKLLPKGTRIDCLAHFDNSADNPANPDPTQPVTWGDQTFEEMMIGYVDVLEELPPGSKTTALNAGSPRDSARAQP